MLRAGLLLRLPGCLGSQSHSTSHLLPPRRVLLPALLCAFREMWAFCNDDAVREAIHAEPINKIGAFDECEALTHKPPTQMFAVSLRHNHCCAIGDAAAPRAAGSWHQPPVVNKQVHGCGWLQAQTVKGFTTLTTLDPCCRCTATSLTGVSAVGVE